MTASVKEVDALLRTIGNAEAELRRLVGDAEAQALLRSAHASSGAGREYRTDFERFAHDLSNILAPVQMSAYLLRIHVEGGEGEEILSAMEASVAQGLELVRRALTFAREEKGQSAPRTQSGNGY